MAFNNDDDNNNDRESTSFKGFVFQHPTQQWSFDFDNSRPRHQPKETRESTPKLDQDTLTGNTTSQSAAAPVDEPTKDTVSSSSSSLLAFSLSQMHLDSNPLPPRDNTRLFKYHSRNERELQAFRRQRALDLQKKIRDTKFNQHRKQRFVIPNEEDDDESEESSHDEAQTLTSTTTTLKRSRDEDGDDDMDGSKLLCFDSYSSTSKGKNKAKNKHSDRDIKLMYGETLIDMPEDWETKWIVIPYPKGKRCMVKAGNGRSLSFNKWGRVQKRFQSMLPNGSKSDGKQFGKNYNVLDCVYDGVHWTFYVLDMLCWKGVEMADCDTSFRRFWLETHMIPDEMDAPTPENMFYKFKILRPIPSQDVKQMLLNPETYLKERGDTFEIDGLMFYHQDLIYTAKETPLVNWVPVSDFASLADAL